MKKRIISLFCALLLLTPGFLLRTRSGRIQYYDYAAGLWHETDVSVASLPNAADRALLARGLPLDDAAALAHALEDFCS